MNAIWVKYICFYKNSSLAVPTVKRLIETKIKRQNILLRKYKKTTFKFNLTTVSNLQNILLEEARAGKHFWHEFRALLPPFYNFKTRRSRSIDITNKLLDIGYHHLAGVLKKILKKYNVPVVMGLLHSARNSDSAPLVYDLIEMFRSDVVDSEVLRFLRLKKKEVELLEAKKVSHFLHEVNERLERKYYIRAFKRCHTYRYYMELQILRFIKTINHKQIFKPIYLPTRHETRCD